MEQQAPWLVAQRYELGEVVGRGGYGMVCRGFDRQTGNIVAIKLLSSESVKDPDVVERMLREQQALVALAGTSAVTAVALCRLDSGAPCLVMEWLDGRDLEQVLSEREAEGKLGGLEELLTVIEPITSTLERAHDMGLFHRDIKPANLFLTPDGALPSRLLDFGLSRLKSAAPITAAGMVMGSPSYIAPETWAGDSRALDGRADLFSLAVIVFRWLTGTLPFDAADLLGKMTAVTSGPRPSVIALRPDLPPAIDLWMTRALAIDRDERYQTGRDFYRTLQAALLGGEYPMASAEASGIRRVASASEPAPHKNPLLRAWETATSLLKRVTGAPEAKAPDVSSTTAPPPAPLPAPAPPTGAVEDATAGEPHSIWLDSAELEEVLSERVPTPTSPPPSASAQVRDKARKKARPKKKRDKKRAKDKKSAKAASSAKKGRKRAKKKTS